MILRPEQTADLRAFVDERVREHGCDHSHRFTEEWAALRGMDWDDLLDILDAQGGFCDCEVVMNLSDGSVLTAEPSKARTEGNWRVPESFVPQEGAVFEHVIACNPAKGRNSHAMEGEWLVPAPQGVKPRKRVRKSVHFFVGIHSGLPSEAGVVAVVPAMSAAAFVEKVRAGAIEELRGFGEREAAFVLSRIAGLAEGTPVGTHFMEVNDFSGKSEELRVHRIFFR